MLCEALVYREQLAGLSTHADCETCPGGDPCKAPKVRHALGYTWPKCPMALMRGAPLAHVVQTYNASKISPLADWPDGYAAFIQDGVIALETATLRKANEDTKHGSRQTPRNFWRAAGVS